MENRDPRLRIPLDIKNPFDPEGHHGGNTYLRETQPPITLEDTELLFLYSKFQERVSRTIKDRDKAARELATYKNNPKELPIIIESAEKRL